jgi:uncharacterized membrane protein YagU involved in acid resistance
MTITMQLLRMWMPREQSRPAPPAEVVENVIDDTAALAGEDRRWLTPLAHFAFGAAAGAVYGAAAGSRRASALTGATYGLGVWALSYQLGLPSLGLHPAASRDTKERNEVLVASHIVWGIALGLLCRRRKY